jgi:hypothetical protein
VFIGLTLIVALALLLTEPDRDIGARAIASTPQQPPASVTVSIATHGKAMPVPSSYLGLSTEYWALPNFGSRMTQFERVLRLVETPGNGPLILRIGGDSADHTRWDPRRGRMPSWVFALTPSWLRQTSGLVRRMHLKLIIDLNFVTASPGLDAEWAKAAEAGLPHGSIIGFEIGNEPDIYSRVYWQATLARAKFNPGVMLPSSVSPGGYTQEFESFASVLGEVAPGVPLLGPAVANPAHNIDWISTLLASPHPGLGMVTAHRYPLSACVTRRSPNYPTIARVLSQRASAGVASAVTPAIRAAHRAGLPFRLTEINSVTCGGLRSVSNTFSTALWAPDTMFELLRAGADGVNLHVRAGAINAPFRVAANGLQIRPLLYGLALFARTLGPDSELLPTQVQTKPKVNVKVWAVRVGTGTLHVLVIDKGSRPVRVDLKLPATAPAKLERLLAPSAKSSSGVTLAGQQLGADARWHGHFTAQSIAPTSRGYVVTVPALSAALLSVPLHHGAVAQAPLARTTARSAASAPLRGSAASAPLRGHGKHAYRHGTRNVKRV